VVTRRRSGAFRFGTRKFDERVLLHRGTIALPPALALHGCQQSMEVDAMNKDRIEGSFEQAKGKAKEVTGKMTGDAKLETEGKADQVAGKVQNAVGGIKDKIKEAAK
jgi:uncharacterized protein YjbJ (UPF0337 family)